MRTNGIGTLLGRCTALRFGCLAAAALFVGVAVVDAQENAAPPKTWHATAVVEIDRTRRVIDYWSRGSEMRARTLINGHPFTTVVSGGRYIVWDGLTGKGLDLGRSAESRAQDTTRPRPFAFEFEEIRRDGGEKVDELLFGARKGEIWQVSDNRGRRKVWVTVGTPQVPLRVETYDRGTSSNVELDYLNWVFDQELPDAFFRPPTNVQLERFEYEAFMTAAQKGAVAPMPILYPDLLHGTPPR